MNSRPITTSETHYGRLGVMRDVGGGVSSQLTSRGRSPPGCGFFLLALFWLTWRLGALPGG
jgi:hypothetical protein